MAVETLAGKELGYFIANLNEGRARRQPRASASSSRRACSSRCSSRKPTSSAPNCASPPISISFRTARRPCAGGHPPPGHRRHRHVRAQYMVAADGAHSHVRETLGIRMQGRGVFSRSVTIYFHADVNGLLRGRNLSVIYVNHPQLRGFFRIEKPFTSGFLAVNAIGDPANPITDVATGLTDAALPRMGAPGTRIGRRADHDRQRDAVECRGQLRRALQPGPRLHRRRRRARDAAERRLRRQHRDPGRAQSGVEAGDGFHGSRPGRNCSTRTTPNAGRSAPSRRSRRTHAMSRARRRISAPTAFSRWSRT